MASNWYTRPRVNISCAEQKTVQKSKYNIKKYLFIVAIFLSCLKKLMKKKMILNERLKKDFAEVSI